MFEKGIEKKGTWKKNKRAPILSAKSEMRENEKRIETIYNVPNVNIKNISETEK